MSHGPSSVPEGNSRSPSESLPELPSHALLKPSGPNAIRSRLGTKRDVAVRRADRKLSLRVSSLVARGPDSPAASGPGGRVTPGQNGGYPHRHAAVAGGRSRTSNGSSGHLRRRSKMPVHPDTCRQGFVWREAFPGDHVCVTPETRAQAAFDNSQAEARRDPEGGFGPDTCLPGFVWREARPGDHVCVTPETRAQTAADNRKAAARRVGKQVIID